MQVFSGGDAAQLEILEDKDWEREWMQHYQPMRFGKRLWGFERGGTDYRISLVPLGGYVRIIGLGPDESDVVGEEQEEQRRLRPAALRSGGPLRRRRSLRPRCRP